MEGLILREGRSYEQISKLLDEAKVENSIFLSPGLGNYFRDSIISVNSERSKVESILGLGGTRRSKFGFYYYAKYEINPEFDWSSLDGSITFKEGNLVERVKIQIRN